jgi:hypothetical protein
LDNKINAAKSYFNPTNFKLMSKAIRSLVLFFFLLFCCAIASVQYSLSTWKAWWISAADHNDTKYGVYHFRKAIELPTKPSSFKVYVSGDNRYKLFVNGQLVSLGPARGDMYYWNYEVVDLAPYLNAGKNVIAALVWNEADQRPEGQISLRTGFLMQGSTNAEEIVNTDSTWRVKRDEGHKPLPFSGPDVYYVAGPGEIVDMNKIESNWMTASSNDSTWHKAVHVVQGEPKGVPNAYGWMLVPSALPPMELKPERIPTVRKAEGISVPKGFPLKPVAVHIPAHTAAMLLLDQNYLTNAYFNLNFSEGKNASITVTYAEALWKKEGKRLAKGNRNDIEGEMIGRKDSIISNGEAGQSFTTLVFRTYRYVKLKVQTRDEPLTIDDIYGTFTGFPFELKAGFKADDPLAEKILQTGWHTARLCAMETYFDCPYYEQLQYIGDTRIQALISYYNTGDDRLARNAITQMDHSRLAEGITESRHPSSTPQIISTFSLWYIDMLHDYWRYRPDSNFVRGKLNGVQQILAFFSGFQEKNGLLKDTPYWTFTDWVDNKGWQFGMAPKSKAGHSAVLDLQLLMAYQSAAEMEAALGSPFYANHYQQQAALLKKSIQDNFWNANKQLYADTEDKDLYSQHTNSLAILTGMVGGSEATALSYKLLQDTTMSQATIYFKYYLHRALIKGGMGDEYMNWLGIWRKSLDWGLTTWPEVSDLAHNRSDCHAWGASPNIEFYRTILGIDSDAPGFAKVKIEPHLGTLTNVSGHIPHPNGTISVQYKMSRGHWSIKINLPENTTGRLVWKGKEMSLKSGLNEFSI